MPLQTKMRLSFGTLIVLVFAWTGWQALDFAELARYMPVTMSALGVTIGIVMVLTDAFNWKRRRLTTGDDVSETAALYGAEEREAALRDGSLDPEAADDAPEDPRKVARRSIMMFGWIVGYVLAIWVLGILVASALFLVVFLLVVARSGWLLPVIGAALTVTGMLVLSELINIEWPPYLLEGVIGI
ncbi:MAG: hypothetical protein GEU93_06735 [Propionibacteriales bacterium]|nr:hypothetical protein [Propionibacteriales bacterium]